MMERGVHTDPRPKLVFIDHSSERGGAEFALLRLLRTRQPWLATLIVPRAIDPAFDAFAELPEWVRVYRTGPSHSARTTTGRGPLASIELGWKILRSAIALLRSRPAREADALVANTTRASVYVAIAGMLMRTPVVVHIRDLVEPAAIGSAASVLMRRFVLPKASGVIANSNASLALVTPYISEKCVVAVIPSPSGLRVQPPDMIKVSTQVRRIGIVARIDPWKGQELLLRAFAIARAGRDETLVLFGGAEFGQDEYLSGLRTLAQELGIQDRLEIAGHVDDVEAAVAGLDVCVQCSTRPEPLGQNVLQYLAAGKPTIVANEGGPSEWVSNGVNGVTFEARNVEDLAHALTIVCDDGDLRRRLAMGAAATPGLMDDEAVGAQVAATINAVLTKQADNSNPL